MNCHQHKHSKKLLLILLGGTLITSAELIGGYLSNSLVLIADAAHYATDSLAILLAYIVSLIVTHKKHHNKTFGYKRLEVLAALTNAIILILIAATLIGEAIQRWQNPEPINANIVIVIGTTTLLANLLLAKLIHKHQNNINIKAAYIHILSDMLGSAAAIIAGLIIKYTNYLPIDPLLTIFISGLILIFAYKLTSQTIHILLEATPKHLDAATIKQEITAIPGVEEIHDLHIWTITPGDEHLTVHVISTQNVTNKIQHMLKTRHNISHVTIQLEKPGQICPQECQ